MMLTSFFPVKNIQSINSMGASMMLHLMMLVLLSVTLVPLPEKNNVTPTEVITVDLIHFMPEKTIAPMAKKEKTAETVMLPKPVPPKPVPIMQEKVATPPRPVSRQPVMRPVAKFVPKDKTSTEHYKPQNVKKSVEKTVDNFEMGQTFPQKTSAPTPTPIQSPSVPVTASVVQAKPQASSLPHSTPAPKSVDPNIYIAGVRQIIANHKTYPKMARKRGIEGVNTVRITLNHLGKVIAIHVVKSAGSDMLDQAATDAVRLAGASLPPFPKDLTQTSLTFDLSFQFNIS